MKEIDSNTGTAGKSEAETLNDYREKQTVLIGDKEINLTEKLSENKEFMDSIELPVDLKSYLDEDSIKSMKEKTFKELDKDGELSASLRKISEATSNFPGNNLQEYNERMQKAHKIMSDYCSARIGIELANKTKDDIENLLPENQKKNAEQIKEALSDKKPIKQKIGEMNKNIEALNGERMKDLRLNKSKGKYSLVSNDGIDIKGAPRIPYPQKFTKRIKILDRECNDKDLYLTLPGLYNWRQGELPSVKIKKEKSFDNFISPLVDNINESNNTLQEQIDLAQKKADEKEAQNRIARAKERIEKIQNPCRLAVHETFNQPTNNKLLALQGRQAEGEQKAQSETARAPQKDSENVALNSQLSSYRQFYAGR